MQGTLEALEAFSPRGSAGVFCANYKFSGIRGLMNLLRMGPLDIRVTSLILHNVPQRKFKLFLKKKYFCFYTTFPVSKQNVSEIVRQQFEIQFKKACSIISGASVCVCFILFQATFSMAIALNIYTFSIAICSQIIFAESLKRM